MDAVSYRLLFEIDEWEERDEMIEQELGFQLLPKDIVDPRTLAAWKENCAAERAKSLEQRKLEARVMDAKEVKYTNEKNIEPEDDRRAEIVGA